MLLAPVIVLKDTRFERRKKERKDMKTIVLGCALAAALAAGAAHAAVPPTWVGDQRALLRSPDPKLAANKKLVFDMWRTIIQGAHTEFAPKYRSEERRVG